MTKTVLENCLRVTVIPSPRTRTVSLGLFIDHGAKDEDMAHNGISHFIEHLVFNPAHMEPTTREHLHTLMGRGATYEAFTGKEFTRCMLTCRRDDLATAMECLGGIVGRGRILPEAVEHERPIILQERDTYLSSGRVKEELIEQALWGARSLGLLVIGRRENIAQFQPDQLERRLQQYYVPQNAHLVVLGHVTTEEVTDLATTVFAGWAAHHPLQRSVLIEVEPNLIGLPTNGSRTDLTVAYAGAAFDSPDRYAVALLADLLGLGIPSRMFQELREVRKLCYAIYGYAVSYRLGGYLAINLNTRTDQVPEAYRGVMEVIEAFKQSGVSEAELERVKAVRITALLDLPGDVKRHLQTVGRYAMLGRDFFVDWECHEMRRVQAEDLLRVARQMFTAERLAISAIGVDGSELVKLL